MKSEHFEVRELADGVYAVVGDQNGLCHSNAGIVDLGDQTLVLDTLTLPSYGVDLAQASRELTGRDPSWIAFTHYHADHHLGNQAFPEATPLVATHAMLPPMEESMKGYQEAIDDPAGFEKQVEDFAAGVEAEQDPAKRKAAEVTLARYRALLSELPSIRLIRPNTLFEGTLRLHGSKRCVELVEVPNAHTASDVYLRLPEEKILFMGDLGFFDTIPFLGYADPIRWIDTLKDFERSEIETYVPGHGIVAGVEKVRVQRECIEAIVEAVRSVLAEGAEVTEELSERLPEPFRAWTSKGRFNQMNYVAVANSLRATE